MELADLSYPSVIHVRGLVTCLEGERALDIEEPADWAV